MHPAKKFLLCRVLNKQYVHFLHISKTGGTAIKVAIEGNTVTPNSAIELHHHRTTLRDIPAGEKIVFCLRDPVTRFVSAFNHRLRQGRPRNFKPWTAKETEAFRQFRTPNQLGLALSSDSPETRRQAERAMKRIMHVNASYWQWFDCEDYFTSRVGDVLFVGFQETLSEDFERLKDLVELPDRLQLPTKADESNSAPDDTDRYLETESIRNLKAWYSRDYDFIQLCNRLVATQPSEPCS